MGNNTDQLRERIASLPPEKQEYISRVVEDVYFDTLSPEAKTEIAKLAVAGEQDRLAGKTRPLAEALDDLEASLN